MTCFGLFYNKERWRLDELKGSDLPGNQCSFCNPHHSADFIKISHGPFTDKEAYIQRRNLPASTHKGAEPKEHSGHWFPAQSSKLPRGLHSFRYIDQNSMLRWASLLRKSIRVISIINKEMLSLQNENRFLIKSYFNSTINALLIATLCWRPWMEQQTTPHTWSWDTI